jgi:uncharacterized coiled-coil DUF342 family protein
METPPEIQFQGMQGTPEIEKTIAAHIAELDERFGRITANVERTPKDERLAELAFAISDAFKHAREQLHDQVRRTRGR